MGNWNQDSSGLTDEDMDQSLEQDKAAAAFEASGGDLGGGYTFGDNYIGDGNYSPQVTDIATARANIAGLQNFYSGAVPQTTYNGIMGITPKNPYGHQGFFSRVLGIDPRSIDYATGPGGLGYGGAAKVAQKKYNRYTNFAGQDARAQKQAFGSLFGNPVGELTVQGPVAKQVNVDNIPLGDALAVQAAGLALGPLGYGLMSMADPFSTYAPTGSEAYNAQFDPAINKDLPTSVMGQAASRTGLGIQSLADSVKDFFSPATPAPTPTSIGSVTPAQYETRADIIGRTSQHPLTGEKTVSTPVDNTLQPGFSRTTTETLPDGRTITVDKETGAVLGTNLLGGPQSSLQNTVAGEQLAGSFFDSLFRDPMISPEAREILKEKGMTIDDLFAPTTPTPEPAKPDIMNMIESITNTSALGGSATANQYADLSGLLSQGMAIADNIVSIPGGYMDTVTGKQYSGSYNPSASGRTYTGTQRSSGAAPFSGASLRQGLANLWGS